MERDHGRAWAPEMDCVFLPRVCKSFVAKYWQMLSTPGQISSGLSAFRCSMGAAKEQLKMGDNLGAGHVGGLEAARIST